MFGSSVALDGDTAIVGAPFDDTPAGTNAGSAYVFSRSGLPDCIGGLDPGGNGLSGACDPDDDNDLIPDAAEPLLCQIEDQNAPDDGTCTGNDYTPRSLLVTGQGSPRAPEARDREGDR